MANSMDPFEVLGEGLIQLQEANRRFRVNINEAAGRAMQGTLPPGVSTSGMQSLISSFTRAADQIDQQILHVGQDVTLGSKSLRVGISPIGPEAAQRWARNLRARFQ